jgi:hypothetical protein
MRSPRPYRRAYCGVAIKAAFWALLDGAATHPTCMALRRLRRAKNGLPEPSYITHMPLLSNATHRLSIA